MYTPLFKKSGMTLVELLIAIGLVMLIFGGIIGSFQFMLALVGSSKAHAGALALANEKMEYLRSLPYAAVGTVGGIPSGLVEPNSTTTINGITYQERVLIEYIDAPQDGEAGDDENGIVADYKLAKVEYSWSYRGETKTVSLISNIVPQGIETTDGGGTLTVNVFDAEVQPIAGASVRVINTTVSPAIDTTRLTNVNGVAMFSGAPAGAGYGITVTKTGYSTDQTYVATTSNPNPVTLPVAVVEAEVSTMNFQIDELSDLTVRTIGEPTTSEFEDQFADATQITSQSNTNVTGDELRLAGTPGTYAASGEAYSLSVTPTSLASWGTAYFDARTPLNTAALIRVYDTTGSSSPALVPDSDLPGNAAGFTLGSVDLSLLDAGTYQSLRLGAALTSGDNATTSAILEWSLSYIESEPPLASIPFNLRGAKVIGSTAALAPIYKYEQSFTTNGSGERAISDLEWDEYEATITDASYDIKEACFNNPFALNPGVDDTLVLTLVSASTHSLRVHIEDADGDPIANADVTLNKGGYNEDRETSTCGGAFFESVSSAAVDYTLTVEAAGFTDRTITDVSIDGASILNVVMSAS
jgi:type II secretory pathway pseudopilin PulG